MYIDILLLTRVHVNEEDVTRVQSQVPKNDNNEAAGLNDHLPNIAFLAKSLSDENRLRVLLCIRDGKKSVSKIVEELQLSQPLVSHHLRELKRSLLVNIERSGPFIYYELADPRIVDILETLSMVAGDLLAARTTF